MALPMNEAVRIYEALREYSDEWQVEIRYEETAVIRRRGRRSI